MFPPERRPPGRPILPKDSFIDITFPIQGIDVSAALMLQRPKTTPVGNNVRAFEPGTNRARGGSRPGVQKYIQTRVAGTFNIQGIDTLVDMTGRVGSTQSTPAPGVWSRTTQVGGSNTSNMELDVQQPNPIFDYPISTYTGAVFG